MNKIIKIVAKAIDKDLDRALRPGEILAFGKLGNISDFTTEKEQQILEHMLNFK